MGVSAGVIAGVSLAATAVAGGLTAMSNIQQANAASKNAAYQAQVAQNNATIAEQNRQYAIKAGEVKAEAQGRADRARFNQLLAGQAASGVDVNSGSPVDVRATQRSTDVFDTDTTLHNALLKAYGYEGTAMNYEAQAGLNQAQSKQATAGLGLSTTAGLLGTASSLGSKWSAFKSEGVL